MYVVHQVTCGAESKEEQESGRLAEEMKKE
jgi:hypothetical protein